MNLYVTQIKRELWENKVSLIYTPTIVSLLILIIAACAAFYSNGAINDRGVHFNFTSNGAPVDAGVTVDGNVPTLGMHPPQVNVQSSADDKKSSEPFNITSSIMKDSGVFNGMIMGVMYANCAMLYLVFSIVMSAYSLRCLFDDRKNKDILFWRSMPVSEATNVLVKLGVILIFAPMVMLFLNLMITLIAFISGVIFFGAQGVAIGYLLSSVFEGGALFIPLQIFYELIFSLLIIMPVIGFALFSSAFARKTPFFIFASPLLLAIADKILESIFGINIGILNIFSIYGNVFVLTRDAFLLQHAFQFSHTMILPLIACLGVGGMFVAGSIWLRNNRYEI